jgi:tetratricopeptide (TPR) repeat protein
MTQSDSPIDPPPPADDAPDRLVLTSPDEASSTKDYLLWAGVLVLMVLVVFSPAMHGKFLWDDDRHVEQNRNLRDAGGLLKIWTKFGPREGGTPQYYPLTHTTYWLEYQLSGAPPGEINTTVFHITNMLLHAGAAILLWLILRELAVPGAWLAAAIFALHPMQAESVAWISERKNVLAGVFYFGAIFAYLRSGFGKDNETPSSPDTRNPTPDTRLYLLALGLFALALLSKTVAVSMPAVVLLLIWYKRGRLTARDFLATAPFFVIGILMAWVTTRLERGEIGAMGPEWQFSFAQRILIAGRAVCFYAEKLVWPVNLAFIYPRWDVTTAQPWQWIFPIGVAVVLIVLFLLRKRIGRGPIAAALIFVGVLVPALGFINFYPMRYSFVANHFQYLAAPALIALIVGGAARAMRKLSMTAMPAPYVVAGVVLVALGALTLMHSTVYASQLDLWAATAFRNPNSWMVRNNYGVSLQQEAATLPPEEAMAKLDAAAKEFERAIALKPDHVNAWHAWGQVLLDQNKPGEALGKFDQALRLKSNNIDAVISRGQALLRLRRLDDALAAFRQAWSLAESPELRPYVPRVKAARIQQYQGVVLVQKKDLEGARRAYANAVRILPEAPDMRFEYGTVLAELRQPIPAAEQFAAAIRLQPSNADARISLALLMIEVGNLPGAQQQLVAAANIDRMNPRLMVAAKKWDAVMREREAAATRPSTTRSTTTQSTTQAATKQSGTTRSTTAPSTQPSR